jgi:NADH-quinone oxidoreductase subunit G
MSDVKSVEKTVETAAPKPPPPAGPPAPPPPKNPGFVTFTVNGLEVIAKPGTNMVEAAKQVGVEIPYYCYHPRLSIAANCRMCMVESSAAPPGKLVPACQTAIAEGVSIKANTAKVAEQQRAVMEFLLLNHPVDCSICDQAGECKLQDYYMRYNFKGSRLTGPKVMRNKRKVLSDSIVLDQERCILCTRCVRFMSEVAKKPQLGVFGRGSHEVVDVDPGIGKLDSNYQGNIVDLCPVGALLNRDFRFRARAWFLSTAPSVCTGCARGCNINADFMGQDVYRFRPRENEAINKSWMCDQGRDSYKLNHTDRLSMTLSSGAESDRRAATTSIADGLKKRGSDTLVLMSPVLSNEDLLAALAFSRDVLKVKTVYASGRANGAADDFLVVADKNPNRRGLEQIAKAFSLELKAYNEFTAALDKGTVQTVLAFGGDVPEGADAFAKRLQTAKGKIECFVVSQHQSALTQAATFALPASTHLEDEGTFTQIDNVTQRFRRLFASKGEAQPTWKWAIDLAKEMGSTMKAASSREVFRTLAPSVPELASFEWDKKAPMNQSRPGISTMASGSDGRPAGWREQGPVNVRGLGEMAPSLQAEK